MRSFGGGPTIAAVSAAQSTADTALSLATAAQPSDSDLTAVAALSTTAFGRSLLTTADAAALLVASGGQASDSDLTSIAALATTAYGRAVLALQDQAALVALLPGYQPVDADLTTLAAITPGALGTAVLAATPGPTVPDAGKAVGVKPDGTIGLITIAAGLVGILDAYKLLIADSVPYQSNVVAFLDATSSVVA